MLRSIRRQKGVNLDIWPGFVDALATLLIVMIFALLMFFISQVYLSDALNSSQKGVDSLQAKLNQISSLLQVSEKKNAELTQSFMSTSQQLEDLQVLKGSSDKRASDAETSLAAIQQQIQELNEQLQKLNASLKTADESNLKQKITIEDLDNKLATAMAQKVEELEKYRSEFFGKLKEVLANRSDIRIVGDRFVFQSEVLFPSASATIGEEGKKKLVQLAATLKEISSKMPVELKWVLRVDGHTDNKPIHTDKFPSNWELSAARAISVIKFLTKEGIAADHLAATGFGEFHPIKAKGDDKNNRRIEFKLDQR